jgi:P4 family phage/plasmid primase-like protien
VAVNGERSGPFPLAWRHYYAADYAPLPLPAGQKKTPPVGYTGHAGKLALIDQQKKWESGSQYQNGNIAHWFGGQVWRDGKIYQEIGIDVDQYDDKHGGDQLKALENQLGCELPETWISGARTDGVSGTRWFLAPAGIKFHDQADSNIDILQRHHRYAMVWPSVHPNGGTCWWFPPGVAPDDEGRNGKAAWNPDGGSRLPVLHELPVLPDEWVAYLTRGPADENIEIDWSLSNSDLQLWAIDNFNAGTAGVIDPITGLTSEVCWNIDSAIRTWKSRIDDDESSHDKINDAMWMIYRLAAEGHTGWKDAADDIASHWRDNVLRRNKRRASEAEAEILRSINGALRKIKPKVELKPVPSKCECFEEGSAKLWHSANVPDGVAKQFALIHERAGTPIRRLRGEWYQYRDGAWVTLNEDSFYQLFYRALRNAKCWGKTAGGPIPWNPDRAKLRNVAHALQSREEVLLPDELSPPCWLDGRDERVISFRNTLLRISDLKQMNHTPAYFCIGHTPVDYDPTAKLDVGKQFLGDLTGKDAESIEALLQFAGTRLVADQRFQKAMLIKGPSGSGKGAWDRWLKKMLGKSKHAGMRAEDYARSGFPTEPLVGKHLMTFSDQRFVANAKAFVDLILTVVGGDELTIRLPYGRRSVGYHLPLSFMFLTNEIPTWPDNAGALKRRIIAISSPDSFADRPDIDLETKLEAEVPALVNEVLAAYKRLCEKGEFVQPKSGQEILGMLRENSSHLEQFVIDCCETRPDFEWVKMPVYRRWVDWCEQHGHKPTAENRFAADLYSLNLPSGPITSGRTSVPLPDGSRPRTYKGLRLKTRDGRGRGRDLYE